MTIIYYINEVNVMTHRVLWSIICTGVYLAITPIGCIQYIEGIATICQCIASIQTSALLVWPDL